MLTRRLLEHAPAARPRQPAWSRHTAATISVTPGWANAGVISFWVFAALALFGAIRRGRAVPAFVWAVPLLI